MIPVALAVLLLIVSWIASADVMAGGDRAAAPRAAPDAHPPARRPGHAGARGRLRQAEGHDARLAAGRAPLRRPQGRPAPPGHDVRRHAGAHPQPRGRRRTRAGRGGRAARRAVRQLARRDDDRVAPAAGDQADRGGRAQQGPRGAGRGRARSRPGQGAAAPGGRPAVPALGLADGEGRIKPSRQAKVRQVEEFLRLLDAAITDGARQGPPAPADRRGPAADRRPRLRQRLPDLRRPPVPQRRAGASGAAHRCRRQGAVARAQHRGGGRAGDRRASFVVGSISGASSTARPRSCSPCTPATPRPTRRSPGRSSGRPRWCSPRRAATTTWPPSCARRPRPAPYAMLTRHGILRERLADTLTDALRASLLRQQGYRVDVVQFVESQHTPRNTMLRATRTGGPVAGGGVRKEYDELVASWGITPAARRAAGRPPVREALAGAAGAAAVRGRPRRPAAADDVTVELTFEDPEIVESSGLAWWATCSSRPTTRATRPGVRRRRLRRDRRHHRVVGRPGGRRGAGTAAMATRSGSATSATTPGRATRSCRGAGPGRRDGDHRRRGPSYELVYPDGARDAESLLAHPITGRLYVATKEIFGGAALRRPRRARPDAAPTGCARSARSCRSRPTGRSSPTAGTSSSAATTGPGLRLPVARAGRARWTCPSSSRARASR